MSDLNRRVERLEDHQADGELLHVDTMTDERREALVTAVLEGTTGGAALNAGVLTGEQQAALLAAILERSGDRADQPSQ